MIAACNEGKALDFKALQHRANDAEEFMETNATCGSCSDSCVHLASTSNQGIDTIRHASLAG